MRIFQPSSTANCQQAQIKILENRTLLIASNRGPATIKRDENGTFSFQRSGGGLVTALLGLVQHIDATWIAAGITEAEQEWCQGEIPLSNENSIRVKFVVPDQDSYHDYYNIISNPLLWFLQHSMWDFVRAPVIAEDTWNAWNNGYVSVNKLFAEEIAQHIKSQRRSTLVFLQDYHLYLAPRFIREHLGSSSRYTLAHFIHIPWPGSKIWGFLPPDMRLPILDGLCAIDLLGFQTRLDALNFIRTVESHLPNARVNYKNGRIVYQNHVTHVRDFPISIDVEDLRETAALAEVADHRIWLEQRAQDRQMIIRIDRTEPSKNIVRGFLAFEQLLTKYPEHHGKVQFWALLNPSRMEVEEYQDYLNDFMAAAGRINARFGSSEWEPVRVLLSEDYLRAVAALQVYDVLLVNAITDGMNLVAKEGPIVNRKDGVLILSEQVGASQQLEPAAMIISPLDIYATAEAIHQGLIMPKKMRHERAVKLRHLVETADINDWFCQQMQMIERLGL